MKKLFIVPITLFIVLFFWGTSGCLYQSETEKGIPLPKQKKASVSQHAYNSIIKSKENDPPTVGKMINNPEILNLILARFPGAENNLVFDYREDKKYGLAVIYFENTLKRIVFEKKRDKWTISMVLNRLDYRNESLFGHITKKHYDFPPELIPSLDPMR